VNETAGRAFLKCLDAKNIQPKMDGKWLRCSCPLARWKHQNHKDNNPSFALEIDPSDEGFYNCFSCGHGSAATLLQTLELYVSQTPEIKDKYNFKGAHEVLDTQELILELPPEYSEFGEGHHKVFVPWPEEYLQGFVHAEKVPLAREYLYQSQVVKNEFGQKCRGFTELELLPFDLRYDYSRGMIVFPYRDVYGRLAGMRGRSLMEHKHHDYTYEGINNASLTWYNEAVLDYYDGWVVVVEGQFDACRVAQGWPKVVANLTATPTKSKLDKLVGGADGTILIPDNDLTGATSVEKYKKYHQAIGQPFKVLHMPEGFKDADEVSSMWLKDQIEALLH
jgi:DNA primase